MVTVGRGGKDLTEEGGGVGREERGGRSGGEERGGRSGDEVREERREMEDGVREEPCCRWVTRSVIGTRVI